MCIFCVINKHFPFLLLNKQSKIAGKNIYLILFNYLLNLNFKIMKVKEIKLNYGEARFDGGLTVNELQKVLTNMNWENQEQVAREVNRCNDRCSDNEVEVEVPVLKIEV